MGFNISQSRRGERQLTLVSVFFACFAFFSLKPAHAIEIESVPSIEGVETWLVENHQVPIVALSFTFPTGAVDQDPASYGASRFLERMFYEGAGDYDNLSFQKTLEDSAIQMNLSIGRDFTSGSLYLPKKHLDQGLELYRLAMTQTRLDSENFERVRADLLEVATKEENNPSWQAARLMALEVFKGHPYEARLSGGKAAFEKMTPQDLTNFAQQIFQRGDIRFAIVGDVSKEEAFKIGQDLFGTLPRTVGNEQKFEPVPLNLEKSVLEAKMPLPQTVIRFIHPSLSRQDEDWFTLNVLNYIVGGGGFNSRLMEEVRVKRGLTYGISTYLDDAKYSEAWYGSVATANATAAEVINLIQSVWSDIAQNGVTEAEVKAAKDYLSGAYYVSMKSNKDVASRLSGVMRYDLGIDYLTARNDKIAAVTRDRVNALAARLMHDDKMLFSAVGEAENLVGAVEVPLVK